jgi:protease I
LFSCRCFEIGDSCGCKNCSDPACELQSFTLLRDFYPSISGPVRDMGRTMSTPLLHFKVAILATDGFEQSELEQPMEALAKAGASVSVVSIRPGKIQGMRHAEKGDSFDVDLTLDAADADDFDALMLPGGLMNPDELRGTPAAVDFVRSFGDEKKPIAAICHGPWLLVEAGLTLGIRLTSWPSIQTDIRNAGGVWEDKEVVVDRHIITSRKPDDLPAFNERMIWEFTAWKNAGGAIGHGVEHGSEVG